MNYSLSKYLPGAGSHQGAEAELPESDTDAATATRRRLRSPRRLLSKRPRDLLVLAVVALMVMTTLTARPQSAPLVVVAQGHNPVEAVYQDGAWSFFIDGSETGLGHLNPTQAVYHLTDAARLIIPDSPRFSFLGNPRDPVWIAPHIENPAILFLGVSGQRIARGVFAGDQLNLRLARMHGPGDFSMYGLDSGGNVELFQSSRDGIDASDVTPFGIGGHDHQNWAFNAPGHYELVFTAFGTLSGGQVATSPEVTYRFAVGPVDPLETPEAVAVDEGDADIAVVLRDDRLVLEVFWGLMEQAYASDEAFYEVRSNSRITVPDDPAFSFLGAPGETAWVAPQTDQPGKLFLALAADNLPTGIFTGERVRVTLKTFEGPGNFSVYQTDAFGTPVVYFNTADGVSDADARDVIPGDHFHMNWGFTKPGSYKVGLEARGTRVAGGPELVSELTTFTFEVVAAEGPRLGIAEAGDNKVTLVWTGVADATYQVQRRDELGVSQWQNSGEPIPGTGSPQSVELPAGPAVSAGYFRLVEQR